MFFITQGLKLDKSTNISNLKRVLYFMWKGCLQHLIIWRGRKKKKTLATLTKSVKVYVDKLWLLYFITSVKDVSLGLMSQSTCQPDEENGIWCDSTQHNHQHSDHHYSSFWSLFPFHPVWCHNQHAKQMKKAQIDVTLSNTNTTDHHYSSFWSLFLFHPVWCHNQHAKQMKKAQIDVTLSNTNTNTSTMIIITVAACFCMYVCFWKCWVSLCAFFLSDFLPWWRQPTYLYGCLTFLLQECPLLLT